MVAEKLVEMIEIHAGRLAADVASDLVANPRTSSFRRIKREELEGRIFQIVHHLGRWISNRRSEQVKFEFSEWGSRRFGEGIPLSEIVFAIILLKQHLRRYIQQNGLIEAAYPLTDGDYVLPMHLHSLQELNAELGLFFDEALYHLTCGYEARAGEGAKISGLRA